MAETDSVTVQAQDSLSLTQLRPTAETDSTKQFLTLKWKNVLVDEFGTMYEFMDNKGNPYTFMINIPNFDFYDNEYFTAKYAPNAQFPVITMLEVTETTWYTATIEEKRGEDEEGVASVYKVITALKPLGQ